MLGVLIADQAAAFVEHYKQRWVPESLNNLTPVRVYLGGKAFRVERERMKPHIYSRGETPKVLFDGGAIMDVRLS